MCAELIAVDALSHPENQQHPLLKPLLEGDAPAACTPLQFYQTLCAPGKPAYVPVEYMTAEQAIMLLHSAGGLAVLAHPGASQVDTALLDAVVQLPFDGLEACSIYHTASQAAAYEAKAQEMHWLVTGGSDFHGWSKPDIRVDAIDWLGPENAMRVAFLAAVSDLLHSGRQ